MELHLKNRYRTYRFAIRAISVFRVKFKVEFPRQVMDFPIELASCLLTNPTELHDFHIEITPWKMHAFDFYSRVEFSDTTQRVNKKSYKAFSMV